MPKCDFKEFMFSRPSFETLKRKQRTRKRRSINGNIDILIKQNRFPSFSIFIFATSACCFSSYRSSRPEVFCKKGVLRNLAKFTGKHQWQRLFFN